MNNIIPSILSVKACGSLEEDIKKDLEKNNESNKTIAELLHEKNEEVPTTEEEKENNSI